MNHRLLAIVGSTVVVGLVGGIPAAEAQSGDARATSGGSAYRVAFAASSFVEGVVADERGTPLAGAMVSALGATSAAAVTDRRGVFTLGLPPGHYVLRAHLAGFVPSRRQFVDLGATSPARYAITLQRAASANASSPAAPTPPALRTPPPPARVLAAGLAPVVPGFDPLSLDPFAIPDVSAKNPDDRGETVWRIRHLPRSILKDTTDRASTAPPRSGGPAGSKPPSGSGVGLTRALGAPARILNDLPLTGQVNLMTSGSFDGVPGLSSSDSAVRGTAFFAIAGPAWSYGDWTARVMTQGTPGSWFISGGFRNRAPSRNLYSVGLAYSSQRLASTTPAAHGLLGQTEPGDRTAGLLYGTGRFTVAPRLVVDYGARLAWYDYMRGSGLISPSVVVTVVPIRRFRIRVGASQRQLAPGAEEFLEPFAAGFWVPPERTFVAYSPMVPERTTQFDAAIEHDLTPGLSLALRSFYQNTTNQQMVLFGDAMVSQPGHYGVADAGDVMTHGWSLGVTHHLFSRLRGSMSYELTEARWWRTVPGQDLLVLGFGPRPSREHLHGLATSLETDLPLTDTHVYVAYRLNTGFTRREGETAGTGFDSRFDVQFSQRLPFLDFTSAQWQVLLVVKNVFRDAARDSSAYDELLVVKPPTRILGGFVVRF
jgi:hypothetical protein